MTVPRHARLLRYLNINAIIHYITTVFTITWNPPWSYQLIQKKHCTEFNIHSWYTWSDNQDWRGASPSSVRSVYWAPTADSVLGGDRLNADPLQLHSQRCPSHPPIQHRARALQPGREGRERKEKTDQHDRNETARICRWYDSQHRESWREKKTLGRMGELQKVTGYETHSKNQPYFFRLNYEHVKTRMKTEHHLQSLRQRDTSQSNKACTRTRRLKTIKRQRETSTDRRATGDQKTQHSEDVSSPHPDGHRLNVLPLKP